jgi:hypothetical protein
MASRVARVSDKRRSEFCPRDRSTSGARRALRCILGNFPDLRGLRQFTSSAAEPNVYSIAPTSRIELPPVSTRDGIGLVGSGQLRQGFNGEGRVPSSIAMSLPRCAMPIWERLSPQRGGAMKESRNGCYHTHDLRWRSGRRYVRDLQSLGRRPAQARFMRGRAGNSPAAYETLKVGGAAFGRGGIISLVRHPCSIAAKSSRNSVSEFNMCQMKCVPILCPRMTQSSHRA